MKKIAISQSIEVNVSRNERRDFIDQSLVSFIASLGYLPITIPNNLSNLFVTKTKKYSLLNDWLNSISVDGFVLSGGNDIGSCPDRDETEAFLLKYAENKKLPVLGICRGMQMMAVTSGVSLEAISGHVATSHSISGEWNEHVNSFHKLAIMQTPNEYKVLARSDDLSIEAMRHKTNRWEAWMWHPERNKPFSDSDKQRFKRLFQ